MVKSKLYILSSLLELINDQHMSPEYFEGNEPSFRWQKPLPRRHKKSNYTPPKKKRKK